MRTTDIEYWALQIIESVRLGQPIEDSRVELKSEWPDAAKAARRVAGHANAVRGEQILWLIGVDETRGVLGVSHSEFSAWYAQLDSQFDGSAPDVKDVNIHINSQTVVALLFDTDRAPYVVRNPAAGKENGGPVELEVPWREGTAVRSARHADLIRILVPIARAPSIEILGGSFNVSVSQVKKSGQRPAQALGVLVQLALYATSRNSDRVVIPFHLCSGSYQIRPAITRKDFETIKFLQSSSTAGGQSPTIATSQSEVIITGPGTVHLEAKGNHNPLNMTASEAPEVRILLKTVDHELVPIELSFTDIRRRGEHDLTALFSKEQGSR